MPPTPPPRPAGPIVGIGEALYDVFDGEARLGGAPLNVAVHAHRLLQAVAPSASDVHPVPASVPTRALVVSRVGHDELGDRLTQTLRDEGLEPTTIQRDPDRPTGRVTVEKHDDGSHTFHIETDAAWDAIRWTDELENLAGRAAAVAFGSLAQRSPVSRATIQRFVGHATHAIKLFDVNLRGSGGSDGTDFYDSESLRRGCELATLVKLNDEELGAVNRLTDTKDADDLRETFALDAVIFTRGQQGTAAYTADGLIEGAPADPAEFAPPDPHADTVGAGDSCSAALLAALTTGQTLQAALDRANAVAAYVAHQPGATPPLPDALLERFVH